MSSSGGAALAAVAAITIVLAAYLAAPTLAVQTTGSSLGAPKTAPHAWSRLDVLGLQLRYARALGLGPGALARAMNVGFLAEGPLKARGLSGISSHTTRLIRFKANAHAPATRLAREIEAKRPRALLLLASAAPQLTRLLERGALRHRPEVLVLYGEYTSAPEWARTVRAWAPARVEQMYGATECPLIATRGAGGSYRLCPGVELEPAGPGRVRVRGFPDFRWHTLADDVEPAGPPGGFVLRDGRRGEEGPWIEAGLALQEAGRLDCFQVQRTGERAAVVAHVGGAGVAAAFARAFPGWRVSAVRGEDAFALPTSRFVKCCGYLDVRPGGAADPGPLAEGRSGQ